MSREKQLVYFILLVLALFTAYSLYQPEQRVNQIVTTSGDYERAIWTDKEAYELGERVEASIMLINHNDYPISIDPIFAFDFSGNSIYEPQQMACNILTSFPAEAKITIPANGNVALTSCVFTPTYPGPFEINGLGLTKTVSVTGYKEVTLNSTGISLDVVTNQTTIKEGDLVTFYLIIRNDNPYPVKVPVYEKFARSMVPIEKQTHSIMIDWVWRYFKVDANSYTTTWTDRHSMRAPGFSLFYMVDGCRADIQLEVTKEETRIFDPVWVGVNSEGISLFLEPSEGDNPTILIKVRNDNSYPVRIKPFSELEIAKDSPDSELKRSAQVDYFTPFWDIPAYSTKTIYNTDAYASPNRSPIYFTLYGKTLRYPPEP